MFYHSDKINSEQIFTFVFFKCSTIVHVNIQILESLKNENKKLKKQISYFKLNLDTSKCRKALVIIPLSNFLCRFTTDKHEIWCNCKIVLVLVARVKNHRNHLLQAFNLPRYLYQNERINLKFDNSNCFTALPTILYKVFIGIFNYLSTNYSDDRTFTVPVDSNFFHRFALYNSWCLEGQ